MDTAALSWFCGRHWDTINKRWKGELNNFTIQLCSPCHVCCRNVSSLCSSALHKSTWLCFCHDCTLQQFVCLLITDKNGALGVASLEHVLLNFFPFFTRFSSSESCERNPRPSFLFTWNSNLTLIPYLIGPSVRKLLPLWEWSDENVHALKFNTFFSVAILPLSALALNLFTLRLSI